MTPKVPNKKKDTLQSIIDKVNERFNGNFTNSDRVIIEGIYQMFMKDADVKKFKKYAKDNSTEMFVQSLFPDKFKDIVTQCFLDNNDSFSKLFKMTLTSTRKCRMPWRRNCIRLCGRIEASMYPL